MPRVITPRLIALSFLVFGGGPAGAGVGRSVFVEPGMASEAEEVLVKPSIVLERGGARPGDTVWAAVRFEILAGWHTYWPGQNDTGVPTEITVTGPEGLGVGAVLWPPPQRHVAPGDILDHVHEGEVTALVPVTLPSGLAVGETVDLSFELSWLVCKEACVPGWETVRTSLAVVDSGAEAERLTDPAAAALFSAARARLPEPVSATDRIARIHWEPGVAVIRVRGAHKLAFYPRYGGARVEDLLGHGVAVSDTLRLPIGRPAGGETSESSGGTAQPLEGLLEVFSPEGISLVYEVRSAPAEPD